MPASWLETTATAVKGFSATTKVLSLATCAEQTEAHKHSPHARTHRQRHARNNTVDGGSGALFGDHTVDLTGQC